VDEYVARLFGPVNEIVTEARGREVKTPFGVVPARDYADGDRVKVLIRPESFSLSNAANGSNSRRVEVSASHLLGDSSLVEFRLADQLDDSENQLFKVQIPGNFDPLDHTRVWIGLAPEDAFVFAGD